jgi:O-acetyl-ADP-ribose deacetylase (regulator of RNase III)
MTLIVSDRDVIRNVLQEPERYAAYVGAGVSIEADVMGADSICNDIRRMIREMAEGPDEAKIDADLKWNDPKRRYPSCLKSYGGVARRVQYFRRLLHGKEPCFAHHAVSLLAARRVLRTTCLTTNFDKLLEVAFARQGEVECQAIRTAEEAAYWGGEPDKCYVLKLHGDYDTHNILNTRDETLEIENELVSITENLVRDGGMIVLGAAGNEDSVQRFFDRLTSPKAPSKRLSMGVFWAVYVGSARPATVSDAELKRLVGEAIEKGSVSAETVEMMNRANTTDRVCGFFPIWGAGSFLFSLIKASGDRSLVGTAERFLDHEMRLRHVFGRAGLDPPAIEAHLRALDAQRRRIQAFDVTSEHVWSARRGASPVVRVLYGDITSRSLMGAEEFAGVRRAVVSPDDTCISAGGGVAYGILKKAGAEVMLNELGKLGPIPQRNVAVTSGGNLPVHYVIHAAAISIGPDAKYAVTAEDVQETIEATLRVAAALHVEMLLIPLVAAGLGPLTPDESLKAILRAIASQPDTGRMLTIKIVIYQERLLGRKDIGESLRSVLGENFDVKQEGS